MTFFPVEILVHLGDPRMRAELEIRVAHGDRDHRHVGAALGIRLAAEALAIAAILASAELRTVRIRIGARRVGGRSRERMIAVVLCRGGEHLARQDRRQRRQRIFARAGRLKRVAARLDLPADVAGLAGNRRRVFEPVVIRLQLVVGDAPVLDRHIGGNEILAVALLVHGAHLELHVGPPPGVAAPMHARSADHLAGQERAEAAHRQRFLGWIIADRQRVPRSVHHEVVPHHVAQLVADVRNRIVLVGRANLAALDRDDLHPGFRQFLRQDTARPAQADDDDIHFLEFRDHAVLRQLMSAMPTGSVGNGLSRYFSTFSRLTASAPGKPIIFQPALLRLPP